MRIGVLLGAVGLIAMGGCAVIYGYGDYTDAEGAVSCALPSDCPGEDTECGIRACIEGKCYNIKIPGREGAPINAQVPGDCKDIICGDNGQIVQVVNDNDKPNDGRECTTDECDGGEPRNTPTPGVPCGATTATECNDAGECVNCSTDADCGTVECLTFTCEGSICVSQVREGASCGAGTAAACNEDGTYTTGDKCSRAGACVPSETHNCNLFKCNINTGCGGPSCETSAECVDGATCGGPDNPLCINCVSCFDWTEGELPSQGLAMCPGSGELIAAMNTCACTAGGTCASLCEGSALCGGSNGIGAECLGCLDDCEAWDMCRLDVGHGAP